MPQKPNRPDAKTLSDALQIAERSLRIAAISRADPFAAVQQAAEELELAGTPAHDRVVEELSEAGTSVRGPAAGGEVLSAVAAQLRLVVRLNGPRG